MVQMINLRNFFLDNCKSEDYYSQWYKEIRDEYLIGDFLVSEQKEDLVVMGVTQIITMYKSMLYPENSIEKLDFILMNFYLKENGYIIQNFPNQINQPRFDFSEEIRQYMIASGVTDYETLGKVTWQERRNYINNLIFEKSDNVFIEQEIDELFKKISTRDSSFNDMTIDEKLKEISNCLMGLIDNYGVPNFSNNVNEYVSSKKVKSLKGKLQCFRHSEDWALNERKNFSEPDKEILIEAGILYIRQYKNLIKKI